MEILLRFFVVLIEPHHETIQIALAMAVVDLIAIAIKLLFTLLFK